MVVWPKRGLLREALAATAASTLLLNNGASIGWSSPSIPSMKMDKVWEETFEDNPFSESMTGAMIILTASLGNIATPYLVSKLGPKMTLLAVDLPLYILGWAGVVAAGPLLSLPLLLLARGLTGISVGLSVSIVPNYVIDISSPQNQGLLGLMPQLMISIGLLGVYVLGAAVDWWWTSMGCLLVQPVILVCLVLMPDSPSSLVARGNQEQARAVLTWLDQDTEERLRHLQGRSGGSRAPSLVATLAKLGRPANHRPLLASVLLLMALQFSGVSPLVFFSVSFFEWANASTSPDVCSIIVASITLATVVAVVLLATSFSRRRMMIVSQAGLSSCLLLLAGYFLADNHNMADSIRAAPLVILVAYFIFFNLGLSSYIWVISAEVLPSEIRNQIIPFAILVSNILWFFVTFFFKSMFDAMGGMFIFLFYGMCSLLFTLTTVVTIPEMDGGSEQQTAEFYQGWRFGRKEATALDLEKSPPALWKTT